MDNMSFTNLKRKLDGQINFAKISLVLKELVQLLQEENYLLEQMRIAEIINIQDMKHFLANYVEQYCQMLNMDRSLLDSFTQDQRAELAEIRRTLEVVMSENLAKISTAQSVNGKILDIFRSAILKHQEQKMGYSNRGAYAAKKTGAVPPVAMGNNI